MGIDEPITEFHQDFLGRVPLAKAIASEIRRIDCSSGAVMGLQGPWGSGKSSLLNLVRRELESAPLIKTVDFNPWYFAGTEQLITAYFAELAEQLRLDYGKYSTVLDALDKYGKAVSVASVIPVLGSWLNRSKDAAEALKSIVESPSGGVSKQKEKVRNELLNLGSPVVIIIDDIDRLDGEEIREVFKLVRLIGNFPNIIYLLAFDRKRVESALGATGFEGRDYLEKIIQITFEVPKIPQEVLAREVLEAIDKALLGLTTPQFDGSRWADVFHEIIRPFIRNVRDIRRYVASLRGVVESLAGECQLVDILALEAIRLFEPDLFRELPNAKTAITEPWQWERFGGDASAPGNAVISELRAKMRRPEMLQQIVDRLFPAGSRYFSNWHYGPDSQRNWLKAGRVAHVQWFDYYFERHPGAKLNAFWHARNLFNLLDEPGTFKQHLESIPPNQLEDAISALEMWEDEYPETSVVPATISITNFLGRLPDRPRSLFEFDADLVITRVALRLIRGLGDSAKISSAVQQILPSLNTLSAKLEIVTIIGYQENAGHCLVSTEDAARFELALREEIRGATADSLALEPKLLRLLLWYTETARASGESSPLPVGNSVFAASLLNASFGTERVQTMGSRSVTAKEVFLGDALESILGSKSAIEAIVSICEELEDPEIAAKAKLARDYLQSAKTEEISSNSGASEESALSVDNGGLNLPDHESQAENV